MKTKIFTKARGLMMLILATMISTNVWATEYTTVATFSSSTVITTTTYATYQNDDWYLSRGGNNSTAGWNKTSQAVPLDKNFGVSGITKDETYGFYVLSKSALANVEKITITSTSTGNSMSSTDKLYLLYSTNGGTTWSQISLNSGSGLSAQGESAGTSALDKTYTFTKIASAKYAILFNGGSSTAATFKFDALVITFYKEKVMRTVQWKVQGENYTTGTPSTSVAVGEKVAKLPTAPDGAPTNCGVFMGWTATAIDGSQNTEPDDLFTTADGAPEAPAGAGAIVYHAVFADIKAVAP